MRTALLACGILSSLLYVGIDVLGALSWPGYDYRSQAISEMSAVGAPTRSLLLPFYLGYDLLLIAFGIGLWRWAEGRLRVSGLLLAAVGLLGFAWPFVPMHLRGAERTLLDAMHLVLAGVSVSLIVLAIGLGGGAFGKRFRLYSIATILALLLFGVLAGLDAPRLDAQLPTPLLGVNERLSFAVWLLWVVVVSVALLRAPAEGARPRRGNEPA